MRGVKDFLTDSLQAMIDYIIIVSTPEPGSKAPSTPSTSDKHERLRIMHALRQRSLNAPVLHREAIPMLPHLLDIPRHLAVITSVVVRYSRTQNLQSPSRPVAPEDKFFAEFSARCMEVEEQALFRVSKLAAKPRRQHSEPAIRVRVPPLPVSPLPVSPSSPWRLPTRERKISLASSPTKRARTKAGRPSTAPSSPDWSEADGAPQGARQPAGSNSTSPRSPRHPPMPLPLPSPSPLPDPPASASGDVYEGRSRAKRAQAVPHARSTSTDSPLARKSVPAPLLSPLSDSSIDGADDAGKRRRNFLRSILPRRL